MSSDYLNPFHVYGSRHQEDNFTRAWLSTLQSLAPAHGRLFLREILLEGRPDLQPKINFAAPDELHVDFQVSESVDGGRDLSREDGALVTIDASGDDELSFASAEPTGRSRPDGMIVDPGSGVTVILEVKLFGGQQASQIARHHAAYFDTETTDPDDVWTSVQWTTAADFLDQLRDCGTSEHERVMLTNFVDYAESLGLAPFRGFREKHFATQDNTTLRKYMRAIASKLEEKGVDTDWGGEKRPKYLGFPDRRDNLWIDYSGTDAFRFGVVSGADSKSTCKRLRKSVRERPKELRARAKNLVEEAQEVQPDITVRFRPHLRVYYSKYRNWHVHCRGRGYTVPEEFGKFCDHVADPNRNPLKRLSRSEVTESFDDLLETMGKKRGSDGLFPPPPDADPVLVHLYINYELCFPIEILLEMGRDTAIRLGAETCILLHETTKKLEDVY